MVDKTKLKEAFAAAFKKSFPLLKKAALVFAVTFAGYFSGAGELIEPLLKNLFGG